MSLIVIYTVYIQLLHCGKWCERKSMEWKENAMSKVWCQRGQLVVVLPAARQEWNLRLAQPQSPGGQRERETKVGERVRERPALQEKICRVEEGMHVRKCARRGKNGGDADRKLSWAGGLRRKICSRVKNCVEEKWRVAQKKKRLCVWVGCRREREGQGVSEHALCGLTLDAGLARLSCTNTPSSSDT